MKDYPTVDAVAELASHPHAERRSWARFLLSMFRHEGRNTLSDVDFAGPLGYGSPAESMCPATF